MMNEQNTPSKKQYFHIFSLHEDHEMFWDLNNSLLEVRLLLDSYTANDVKSEHVLVFTSEERLSRCSIKITTALDLEVKK